MGSKKGGAKYKVVDYYMSIWYGICHGPVDALTGIYVKERDAWPGKTKYDDDEDQGDIEEDSPIVSFGDFLTWFSTHTWDGPTGGGVSVAVSETALPINRMDLFGGDKKEGGVKGTAYYLPGGPEQVLPENLAAKLGVTSATAPGNRGVASVFFYGKSTKRGFMWAQNNPYMPPTWFTVFRAAKGLSTAYATIQRGENPPDANPSHMIFECLSNTDWGMGAPDEIIDSESFESCAILFFNEKLGLSMIWAQQTTIEAFVSEILDHVQATLFVNPRTGKLTLRAIRGDYDIDTLRVINPDNADATNRQRKSWAETINEIVVTWTNPSNEQEETITFQDLANIAMQGGIVSDPRSYYGARNAELASELAVRDLRSSCYPLYGCDVELDRKSWDLIPGDVVKYVWPEDGITQIIMRVGKVNYGRPGAMTIRASLLEDVFSLEKSEFTLPPTTGWESQDQDPDPFEHVQLFTVPLPMLVGAGLDLATADEEFPRVVPGIFASQPGDGTYSFELNGPKTLPNGDIVVGPLGTRIPTPYSETTVELPFEAETEVTQAELGILLGGDGPALGSFLVVGEGTDYDLEIMMVDTFDEDTGIYTLARGIMDTVPKAWPEGTPVWYVANGWQSIDRVERLAGQTVDYQLQTRTRRGLLPLDQAPEETITLTARPYLPFRPANTMINGTLFSSVYTGTTRPATIDVTWANRNRLLEDQIVRRWTDGNVTPEIGQTTTIKCYEHGTDVLLATYTGISGTSYSIPYYDLLGYRDVDVMLLAVRDGLESLQGLRHEVLFDLFGYGNNYGNDYGENDG